ncbi:hypothetical protein PVAG01_07655 [Phlyctema vagabunda]|uniref:Uncharacterized protein n=1 Tax=Phlyctema vagabunda TaxID=108571 RepID=A0ABR4PD19_9HELO
MTNTTFVSGAIVSVKETHEGQYEVTQVSESTELPKSPRGLHGRHDFDWSFGPITVTGYVVTDTWEIGVEVKALGIKLGNFYGSLKDGLGININLLLITGQVKFYLKNGNELWIHVDVKVKFDGSFQKDAKIISF